MTALTRTPQNTNLLQPTKFLLTFTRLPNTTFFCQAANIPGVSLGQAPLNTPTLDISAPGNKMTYNPFNIHFLVDEQMNNWQELHQWFREIASPESFAERKRLQSLAPQKGLKPSYYSDGTLTVLSALNNPILRVEFKNMFPTSLSDVTFDSSQSADDIITADATFKFDFFNFVDVSS